MKTAGFAQARLEPRERYRDSTKPGIIILRYTNWIAKGWVPVDSGYADNSYFGNWPEEMRQELNLSSATPLARPKFKLTAKRRDAIRDGAKQYLERKNWYRQATQIENNYHVGRIRFASLGRWMLVELIPNRDQPQLSKLSFLAVYNYDADADTLGIDPYEVGTQGDPDFGFDLPTEIKRELKIGSEQDSADRNSNHLKLLSPTSRQAPTETDEHITSSIKRLLHLQ